MGEGVLILLGFGRIQRGNWAIPTTVAPRGRVSLFWRDKTMTTPRLVSVVPLGPFEANKFLFRRSIHCLGPGQGWLWLSPRGASSLAASGRRASWGKSCPEILRVVG